jgi:hypothetical protein
MPRRHHTDRSHLDRTESIAHVHEMIRADEATHAHEHVRSHRGIRKGNDSAAHAPTRGRKGRTPETDTSVIFLLSLLLAVVVSSAQPNPSTLQSSGMIYNAGTLRIRGDADLTQDTILGRVQYIRDNGTDTQRVAHVTYDSLYMEGASRKMLMNTATPVVAMTLFSSRDAATPIDMALGTVIEAYGRVVHNGIINVGRRDGTFRMNGTAPQDLSGAGQFAVLEINNGSDVAVSNAGGARINGVLDLQRGAFRTSVVDNVAMMDDAWIWRNDSASISATPVGDRYSVRYYGTMPTLGGAELPPTTTVLQKLLQEDTAGLTLPYDITVNDSLVAHGHIYTEQSDTTRFALTFTPQQDPRYVMTWPEINGTMIRANVRDGVTYRMNARDIAMRFNSAVDQGAVRSIRLRNKPQTIPQPSPYGDDKVMRWFQLSMLDATAQQVPDGAFNVQFGYAWRHERNTFEGMSVIEVIPILAARQDSLALQHWDGTAYVEHGVSRMPTQRDMLWRWSIADSVNRNGDYAIGIVQSTPLFVLRARVFLEGAMRENADNITPVMSTELRDSSRLPTSPPGGYPFNLDLVASAITVPILPDSVVDWMVIELRTERTGGVSVYRTCLLTRNGYFVDPFSLKPLTISGLESGQYYIVFRHRNHLAVMTEDKKVVDKSTRTIDVDLTNGTGIFGGAAAMKLLGTVAGSRFFGLVGGQVNDNDIVDRDDYNIVWYNRDVEGYSLFDTNLDGIISTDDLNLSWNNRGRTSVVP